MPNFKEAVESMSEILRWNPEPKNAEDKSLYLGNVITGYYVGMKTDIGQNDSNLYEIEVIDPAAQAGRLVAMWGSSLLDGKFEEIPQGCMVRVTYLGIAQPKTPKGRAYQNFKVEYDSSARRPMREATPANAAAAPAPAPAPAAAPAHGDGF